MSTDIAKSGRNGPVPPMAVRVVLYRKRQKVSVSLWISSSELERVFRTLVIQDLSDP